MTRVGKLLCRLGLHRWQLSNGIGHCSEGSRHMLVLFTKDCGRCGKHETGAMIL